MATKREQILAALKTKLTGTTGVSTRIYRSRPEALTKAATPAIILEPVSDNPGKQILFSVRLHGNLG